MLQVNLEDGNGDSHGSHNNWWRKWEWHVHWWRDGDDYVIDNDSNNDKNIPLQPDKLTTQANDFLEGWINNEDNKGRLLQVLLSNI